MEFIKVRNGYLVKGSNGLIVDEKEKEQLESGELSIKGATCEACRIKTHKVNTIPTATSKKQNKKKKEKVEEVIEVIEEPIEEEAVEVVEDDSIEETSIII